MLPTTIAQAEDDHHRRPAETRDHRPAHIDAVGRRRPLVVAVPGLALMGLSATALALSIGADRFSPTSANRVRSDTSPLAQVTTTDLVYESGHSSGWHVHPGVHSVVVLSGTLSVYDGACRRSDYGPGQIYLGGREPHLARNAGMDALALAVTYVSDSRSETPGSPVPPPTSCEAS